MYKFGISVCPGIEYSDLLPMLREIGFSASFSHHLETDFKKDIAENRRLADRYDVVYETSHCHMPGNAAIWQSGTEGDDYIALMNRQLDVCGEYDVPIMIVHVEPDFTQNPVFETGLERFKVLVDHAEKNGVKLAFENLNAPEFLFKTLDYFTGDNIGFCYDVGHAYCKTHDVDYMSRLGKRLMCTHIHDNHGGPDEHLLPFEGIVDFRRMYAECKACGYTGYLTMEMAFHDFYREKMTDREFVQACYDSLVRMVEEG